MNIPGTSGFHHFEIKYTWQCRACGVLHEESYKGLPDTMVPYLPGVPEGWIVLTRNLFGTVMDAFCPEHRIVIQNNEVNVHAKEATNA